MFLFIFYAEMQLIPSVSPPVVTTHMPEKQPIIHSRTQKIYVAHICYIEKKQ